MHLAHLWILTQELREYYWLPLVIDKATDAIALASSQAGYLYVVV
jgi:hypothetical protein